MRKSVITLFIGVISTTSFATEYSILNSENKGSSNITAGEELSEQDNH